METQVFLITHAVTQWHLIGKVQGHYDTVLNHYGHAMAEELINRLKDERIDLIITSDLKRAYQTAEPLSKNRNIPIMTDAQLREGRWDARYKNVKYPLLPFHIDFEDVNILRIRISHAITKIIKENEGKSILIISHEGAIKHFISEIRKTSEENIPEYKGIRTAINCFQHCCGKWSCKTINDGDYLKQLHKKSFNLSCFYLALMIREKLAKIYVQILK